jgi:hypothetical protein
MKKIIFLLTAVSISTVAIAQSNARNTKKPKAIKNTKAEFYLEDIKYNRTSNPTPNTQKPKAVVRRRRG